MLLLKYYHESLIVIVQRFFKRIVSFDQTTLFKSLAISVVYSLTNRIVTRFRSLRHNTIALFVVRTYYTCIVYQNLLFIHWLYRLIVVRVSRRSIFEYLERNEIVNSISFVYDCICHVVVDTFISS